jgi:glycosyltransferase involved in cell wall biosynthesis
VERLLRRTGIPLVYDFDDAIWLTDTSDSNRHWSGLKCSRKTAELCRIASAVVVGNETLGEYARRYNENVWVIPSTVDTEKYSPREHSRSEQPTVIGWSGSQTTARHLGALAEALRRVAALSCVELRVMGAAFELPGVQVSLRRWSPESEAEHLRSFDIGVMPLPDDAWSRGKCGMKALLYMAVGVPVVASPVGVSTEIIQDGVNGILAATEDDWVEKLIELIDNVQLRRRLGAAGRATVEARYSLHAQAPRVLQLLNSMASTSQREQKVLL